MLRCSSLHDAEEWEGAPQADGVQPLTVPQSYRVLKSLHQPCAVQRENYESNFSSATDRQLYAGEVSLGQSYYEGAARHKIL